MAKYFKNIKNYEDLKAQFKQLLKTNHPDNGGDVSKMQDINAEYDALFKIWKNKQEQATGEEVTETADSTRQKFYTDFGWEGSNHNWNRTLKEVAQIVRAYIKEKYPTFKFSVRTSYASMCQELHVSLKEAPADIYNREPATWTDEERHSIKRKLEYNHIMPELSCWRDEELTAWLKEGLEKVDYYDFYMAKKEDVQAMLDDVNAFVKSYNYEDCDGMIDYFDVDFYYFGVKIDDLKIVPKAARIAKPTSEIEKSSKKTESGKVPELEQIEEKTTYTFKITRGEDTRDNSELWIVRIVESLSKEEYTRINKAMQTIGGYYSKFKHGFIFRFEPSEKLKEVA